MHKSNRRYSGTMISGLIVIAVGVLFLLKTMGIFPDFNLADYWPVLLIIFGLIKVISPCSKRSYYWGTVIALIGGAFLARNLHFIDYDIMKLWPVIPILIGISILLRPVFGSKGHCHSHFVFHGDIDKLKERTCCNDESIISDDELSVSLVLSGGNYRCTSTHFKGGNISLNLAGCEIDLRNVTSDQGEIFLDVNLLLGGVEMRIPETWSVSFHGTPVLGSFEDNTRPINNPEKKLIVRGSITLAGFEVRN